ncbi:DUF3857 domain-containing protein [Maribacter antarcticus]|uniref:DUF3857 domain-containing protein n=1 Tax=Maribacter antarcticus TaxID=505250 RepID=UPI00047A576C|nr:DUF3857 domain-containing protein [Maribacter antarcticus]
MRLFSLYCAFLFSVLSSSQNLDYSILTMDKALTKDANAVVRLDEMKIEILGHDHLRYKVDEVITVLNKFGNYHSTKSISFDKELKIKDLEVFIYDQLGNEIDHFNKKNFTDVSAADGFSLFNDDRVLRHKYTPISYPYTIHTSYEVETSDTGFFPPWYFLSNYRESVQKSYYEITYARSELKPEIKEHQLDGLNISKIDDPGKLVYSAAMIPAIKYEELSPSFRNIVPRLSVRMIKFNLKGEEGQVESWSDFGKWMDDKLLSGADELAPETITRVKELVEGIEDDLEKAKIIYKYVQDNTRYISVQIGIGGWKPISAINVDEVKYGDCKGLSNYTYALFKAVGVTSHYTVIYAGKDKIDFEEDFAVLQGNHAILAVPYNGTYYWIDCTSQVHPFGFVGGFTDDRKALIVTPNGGKIIKTVSYINEDNSKKTVAQYTLGKKGDIKAMVYITSEGIPYDNRFYLENETNDNVVKAYKEYWSTINNIEIKNIDISNNRDKIIFKEEVLLEAANYGTISGNRMFFTPNAFDRNTYIPNRYRNRTRSLVIDRGYSHDNDFLINLPEGYAVEAIPDNISIANEFGEYLFSIEYIAKDNTIKYKRKLFIKKGVFKKDKYKAYRDFRKETATADNSMVVLIKK